MWSANSFLHNCNMRKPNLNLKNGAEIQMHQGYWNFEGGARGDLHIDHYNDSVLPMDLKLEAHICNNSFH